MANAQAVLETIEQDIADAFNQSFAKQTDLYTPLYNRLEEAFEEPENPMITYWQAFICYRAGILQSALGQKDTAQMKVQQGIELLKSIEVPNSEHLALQGMLTSYSITFQGEMAAILSSKANVLYTKAQKLDDQNLRAYLGAGKSDYYRPKEYGGGLTVEENLKKALQLAKKSMEAPGAPTWGKDQAYLFLAKFYHREGREGEAKLYCMQGLKAYPNHPQLMDLKETL